MRIYVKTTPNKELVSFNYQSKLTGALHKWIGKNELHGKPALYSFSWLFNAEANKEGLNYPNGAKFFISFHDEKYLKRVVSSILSDTDMCFGMKVIDITIEEKPDLTNKTLFLCASPIFVRRFEPETNMDIYYTFKDEKVGTLLEETLLHKMELADIPKDESLKIKFDLSYPNAKTKIINYKGINNRVNICPVSIE